jgi:hypothetical protein
MRHDDLSNKTQTALLESIHQLQNDKTFRTVLAPGHGARIRPLRAGLAEFLQKTCTCRVLQIRNSQKRFCSVTHLFKARVDSCALILKKASERGATCSPTCSTLQA